MKVKLTTTLVKLKDKGVCIDGYRKLIKHLGADYPADKPINLLTILDSNGVQDMLWCLRATREDCVKIRCYMAADFAESVLHIFAKKYPNDDRPAKAIQAARDFADSKINKSADAAAAAAYAAADAAAADADAAAADAAAADADAADAAADAAAAAAAAAAYAAARAKEKQNQAEIIRRYLAE